MLMGLDVSVGGWDRWINEVRWVGVGLMNGWVDGWVDEVGWVDW